MNATQEKLIQMNTIVKIDEVEIEVEVEVDEPGTILIPDIRPPTPIPNWAALEVDFPIFSNSQKN